MSSKRQGAPFMPPDQFGKSLSGLMLNLLVRDLARAVEFHREVLQVEFVYADPDLAIVRGYGSLWMIHADHTYDKHPYGKETEPVQIRGRGMEIRLHGLDPDSAEANARRLNFTILDPTRDQPDHGLRECFIRDADGYVWVPDVPLK